MNATNPASAESKPAGFSLAAYNRFLLLVAGLGGLLYGIDVGIIAGALPYLEATFTGTGLTLNAGSFPSSSRRCCWAASSRRCSPGCWPIGWAGKN